VDSKAVKVNTQTGTLILPFHGRYRTEVGMACSFLPSTCRTLGSPSPAHWNDSPTVRSPAFILRIATI